MFTVGKPILTGKELPLRLKKPTDIPAKRIPDVLNKESYPLLFFKAKNSKPTKVERDWRGEDFLKKINQEEIKLIFYFDTLIPKGLNKDFKVCHFL